MAIFTGIGAIVISIFGGDNLSFFAIYSILAFSNLVLRDIYIGENLIVYYNTVLRLDEIERFSKEYKIAHMMVRYWINGKS